MREWNKLNEQEQEKWIDHIQTLIDNQEDCVIKLWNEYNKEYNGLYDVFESEEEVINEVFKDCTPMELIHHSFDIETIIDSRYFAMNSNGEYEYFYSLDDYDCFDVDSDYEELAKFAYEEYGDEWLNN